MDIKIYFNSKLLSNISSAGKYWNGIKYFIKSISSTKFTTILNIYVEIRIAKVVEPDFLYCFKTDANIIPIDININDVKIKAIYI